jgi:hypothetical protein
MTLDQQAAPLGLPIISEKSDTQSVITEGSENNEVFN